MTLSKLLRVGITAIGLLGVARHAPAQPASGPLYDSYRRAFAILERSLAAHGGGGSIRSLRSFAYRYDGFTYDRDQGALASHAYDSLPPRRPVGFRVLVDWAGGRQLTDFGVEAPGEGRVGTRVVTRGREQIRFTLGGRDANPRFVRDSLPAGAPSAFPFQHQLMPPVVLRQAIVRGNTLRYVGRRSLRTGVAELVSFANADGNMLAVGIDSATGLVSTVETVGEIGLFGDGDHVWRFRDYTEIDGLKVPRGFQHLINGLLQEDMQLVSVAVNQVLADSLFAPPAGAVAAAPPPPPAAPRVARAAEGAHYVEGPGGYRVLFVEWGDSLIAVEAPQNVRAAEQALALIRQAVPGKRISHLVLTHHHLDHVAGARAFAEQGAVIVVPQGMEEYIKRVITGERTFGRLGLPATQRPLAASVQSVTARRRLGPLELVPITSSHATHMLLAYLPERRHLFQGDLVQFPLPAKLPPAARDLLRAIRDHRLAVDSIGSVHGSNGSFAALGRRRKRTRSSADRVHSNASGAPRVPCSGGCRFG